MTASQTIVIDGESFDTSITHFRFAAYHRISDMAELRKLASLPNLESATFDGTNLDDAGLEHVSHAKALASLSLQETSITNAGIAHLARLPKLSYLRLKDNPQLTNECVPHLCRLHGLTELQIHETSIDQAGLDRLGGLSSLSDLCIDVHDGNYTFDALLALSARMPGCTILAKGRGEFSRGKFAGDWRD